MAGLHFCKTIVMCSSHKIRDWCVQIIHCIWVFQTDRLWQHFCQVLNVSHFFLHPRTTSSAVNGVEAQLQRLKIEIDMPNGLVCLVFGFWSRKPSHPSGGEIFAVNCVWSSYVSYVQAMTGPSGIPCQPATRHVEVFIESQEIPDLSHVPTWWSTVQGSLRCKVWFLWPSQAMSFVVCSWHHGIACTDM